MRKFFLVAALAVAVAIGATVRPELRHAEAGQPYPDDRVTCFKGSISVTAPAVVMTAVETQRHVAKVLVLNASAAGNVTFTDGVPTIPASNTAALATVYLEANKPFTVNLGGGIKTTAGNALYARSDDQSTCILTATIVYNKE